MNRNGALRINLFTKCVVLMTVCQAIYDTSLLLNIPCGIATTHYTCTAFYIGGFTFGGIGAALWSLISILLTLFLVEYGRKPTFAESVVVFAVTHIFLLGWSIPFSISMYNSRNDRYYYDQFWGAYNNCRLALIILITLVIMYLYYRMRQVTVGKNTKHSSLHQLTKRLIWYPVVQVVCRLGVTPYGMVFGTIATYPESAGPTQTACLFLYVICTPLAGLGAFIVFLFMQRGAVKHLKDMVLFARCIKAPLADSGKPTLSSQFTSKQRSIADLSSNNSNTFENDERANETNMNYVYEDSPTAQIEMTEMEMDEEQLMDLYISERSSLVNQTKSGIQNEIDSGVNMQALTGTNPLNKNSV